MPDERPHQVRHRPRRRAGTMNHARLFCAFLGHDYTVNPVTNRRDGQCFRCRKT